MALAVESGESLQADSCNFFLERWIMELRSTMLDPMLLKPHIQQIQYTYCHSNLRRKIPNRL